MDIFRKQVKPRFTTTSRIITSQEAMESFAFPLKIKIEFMKIEDDLENERRIFITLQFSIKEHINVTSFSLTY